MISDDLQYSRAGNLSVADTVLDTRQILRTGKFYVHVLKVGKLPSILPPFCTES